MIPLLRLTTMENRHSPLSGAVVFYVKGTVRIAKNTERLALLFGLGNLLIAEGQPRR